MTEAIESDRLVPRTPRPPGPPAATPAAGRELQEQRSYESLRTLIVEGRLAPGSRIMAADLAKRLDVGRRTVHVALHRLEQEGLLQRLGGSYARWLVPPLTVEGFREVLELIGLLEAWGGRTAAQLPAEPRTALVAEMRQVNARFRAAGSTDAPDDVAAGELDHRFHDLTSAHLGPQLRATLEAYRPRLDRYVRSYMGYLVMDIAVSADEHEVIIDAIEDGDAEATEQAIRANRFRAIERYAAVITRLGERGQW
jgi:DNA-binding GntR family transcriptional regulator